MAEQGYVFTERDKAEFNRLRRKIDSIRGPGVVNSADAISINAPPQPQRRAAASRSDTLPVGQYVGMAWLVVTNNQSAFAYPFAVQTV